MKTTVTICNYNLHDCVSLLVMDPASVLGEDGLKHLTRNVI